MKTVLLCVIVFKLLGANCRAEIPPYPAWIPAEYKHNSVFTGIFRKQFINPPPPICENPIRSALESFPLIDGHNDLAFSLYRKLGNNLTSFNFNTYLKSKPGWEDSHTDIPRLRRGKVGAQFWSAFVFCETQYKDAVSKTLDQIDVIKRLIKMNPHDLEFTTTADGITEAFKDGKIASLIGIEGGHSIDSHLGVLRMYYDLGVRYLTLTHSCNTPWATSSTADGPNSRRRFSSGLSEFGKKVVMEMNRLGMLVDLAHVSRNVMYDAITTSVAPVIFSHSSAYAVNPHPRNVDDDILRMLKKNHGIIMVTFYPGYVGGGDTATLHSAIDHINYIVDVTGPDHVGIGGDFDGIPKTLIGLEDVSKYPDLLEALFKSNPNRWTQRNLEKLIGRNFMRVFKEAERIRDKLAFAEPFQDVISEDELNSVEDKDVQLCRTEDEEHEYAKLIHKMNNSYAG